MILGKNKKMKAGVSLVTVLLFMLVATIAATATFKWLTSEGRCRMMMFYRHIHPIKAIHIEYRDFAMFGPAIRLTARKNLQLVGTVFGIDTGKPHVIILARFLKRTKS